MRGHYTGLPEQYYAQDHVLDQDIAWCFERIAKDALLLNVGCGRAESLLHHTRGYGMDFNDRLAKLWRTIGVSHRCVLGAATALPWKRDAFEWTVSMDFLEHVAPSDIGQVLLELQRVAPRGCHVVDTLPQSGWRGPAGENLHPSANTHSWWDATFHRAIADDSLTTQVQGAYVLATWGPHTQ